MLYNPGLGHWHLRDAWAGALRDMLATGRPLVVTAHSARDQERDRAAIEAATAALASAATAPPPAAGGATMDGGGGVGGPAAPSSVHCWTSPPARNEFRSRKRALDPADPGHVTAANWGTAIVLYEQ